MRFEVNLSILFTELPAARAAGRSQAGGLRRRRVLVALAGRRALGRRDRRVRRGGRPTPACSWSASTSSPATCPAATAGWSPGRPAAPSSATTSTSRSASASGWAAGRSTRSTATGPTTPRRTEQDALAAENLALAARAAQRIGGTVLVEPVSGAPRYPLLTAADALGARSTGPARPNVALLLDVYHLAVNGDDVDAAIDAARGPDRARPDRRRPGPQRARHRKARHRPLPATASPPPATTAGSGSSTSPPAPAPTPSTGCPARAARPAEPPSSTERCFRHDDRRLHRPGHHGRPDGRATSSRPASRWSATTAARTRSTALVDAGGRGADSVAEAVRDADVIITMVPDSPGRRGRDRRRRRGLRLREAGALYVDMSTIRPDVAVRVAEAGRKAGLRVLDAPVSGGEAGAIEGSLSIMVGGEPADFEAAQARAGGGRQDDRARRARGLGADRQGREPADRRRQHRAARRGGRLPRGVRRGHEGRAGGARRRPGRQHRAEPQGRRTCSPASSRPASGSPCTTRTWGSSRPPPARPASSIPLGAVGRPAGRPRWSPAATAASTTPAC